MKKIIIDVSDEEAQKIDKLMRLCNLSTRKAYFKATSEILEWLIEQRQLGRKIFAHKPGEDIITELESPSLRSASMHSVKKTD